MMFEIDEQLGASSPDLVVCPVGVGSFAQAVVTHFKADKKTCKVLTVEPDNAACLYASLRAGEVVPLESTGPTIMEGMNCGTVSTIAWPILQCGVDASWTVSDREAHQAVEYLEDLGISAGPCGASTTAALLKMTEEEKKELGLSMDSTLVVLCTEGKRTYTVPSV